jgi:SAM-dependent methyltransferase
MRYLRWQSKRRKSLGKRCNYSRVEAKYQGMLKLVLPAATLANYEITLINDVAPGYSPVDIVERGGLMKIGQWLALANYEPMTGLAADEADLVTCYIGLHHCPLEKLEPFIDSAVRALRKGGLFILRDHDVKSAEMNAFVGLAHTVFNAGLNAPWSDNANELRFFRSVDDWITLLAAFGLKFTERRILQEHDPSDNVLMAFEKV